MEPIKADSGRQSRRGSINRRAKTIIILALVPSIFVGLLVVFRVCGFIRLFSIPNQSMTPALSAGDHVLMEDMTYLWRQPRVGDIVVFKSDGIPALSAAMSYAKRVAGEPGDHVRISSGKLFINNKQVSLSNAFGEIVYDLPPQMVLSIPMEIIVPNGCYYVLGDNSTNSFDSRFWGCVPRENILGRISFCYWPPGRAGGVK